MPRIRKAIPGVDPKLLIKDAAKLMPDPARRAFLRGAASLGALTFLTGCDIVDSDAAEGMLRRISRFNDRVQAWLFNPNKLAPTYPESAITRPFPFNAYYPEDDAPEVDGKDLQARGRRSDRQQGTWTLEQLYALPQETQITRHICVEGWSAIGSWQGVRLSEFLQARRRRHAREIRLVPVRRGLFQHHRHGDGAASADPAHVQVRQRDPAAQVRLPDEMPDPDQARVQESQVRHRACTSPTRTSAAIGRTRATTGSADCSGAL